MRKNVGNQTIGAQILDTAGDPITTGNCPVVVTIDGGTQANVGNATHEGNGTWVLADTGNAANTNGNHTIWTFVPDAANSTTVAVQVWPVAHASDLPEVTLGNVAHQGTSLAISGNVTAGNATVSGTTALGIVTATSVTSTGNITAANIRATGNMNILGQFTVGSDFITGPWTTSGDLAIGGDITATNFSLGAGSFSAATGVINSLTVNTNAIAWNAAWDAEVESEVTDALNSYDPPTNAEMEARTLVAASYFDPAADTVATVTTVTNSGNATLGNNAHQGTSIAISGNLTAGNIAAAVVGDITGNLSGSVGSVTGAVGSVTGNVAGSVEGNVDGTVAGVTPATAGNVTALLTTQMTESYAADGVAPTLAQSLMLIQQSLGDFAISGTTISVKKLDGSTEAATFTLDDGTNPTSTTRAT